MRRRTRSPKVRGGTPAGARWRRGAEVGSSAGGVRGGASGCVVAALEVRGGTGGCGVAPHYRVRGRAGGVRGGGGRIADGAERRADWASRFFCFFFFFLRQREREKTLE